MKLGIISPVCEESFVYASKKGLDFVEFCINGDDRGEELFSQLDNIRLWIEKYNVSVGSIGRWKSVIQSPSGVIDPAEVELASALMTAACELGCPNYICGINFAEEVSLFTNCCNAVEFFSRVLRMKPDSVEVSVYNCRKMNFVNTPQMWRLIHGHLPELGIKYDPSHSIQDGADYLGEALEWADRFNHVHLKGSLVINGVCVDDPPAGLDSTDWKSFLAILRAKGYCGGLSIEPHSKIWDVDLREPGIDYTINYIRGLLANK